MSFLTPAPWPRRCAVLAALAAALGGCADPELGDAPFLCNPGNPSCPDGYACATVGGRRVCVRQGMAPLPADDATPADGGGADDAPADDAPATPPQRERTVVISEFLAHPLAVAEELGEYVELFNMTDAPVDLKGWTIKDDGADSHTIATQLIVLPRRYVVLAASADSRVNGGVAAAYQLSRFTLGNTMDDILLLDSAGKVIDGFSYAAADGFALTAGVALSLRNPFQSSDVPSNWCEEPAPWSGSAGDRGSPGAAPRCQ